MTIYRSMVAFLAALSADPNAIEQERPKAYASYVVAYATFAPADDAEPTPAPPKPTPRPTREPAPVCPCGGTCSAACSCGCRGTGACASGTCPIPSKPRTAGGK